MSIVDFLRARYDELEQAARAVKEIRRPWYFDHLDDAAKPFVDLALDPDQVLADLHSKRRILDEHAPQWQPVEWPHDQNGKGEAQVCRRCQNAEHTEWDPPLGKADVLPDGFVAPYVLWPCPTVQFLVLPIADQPEYRPEWGPQ